MATKELLFVVDTDTPHRKMMAGWLRDQGYRVKVFDNGELCLNMLDENPDAICLDINMSAGLDILKRLKLANRDIPVLVVTENDAVDSAVEAMKIGAFDYMAKPVDKVRLKTNVERAIEMHTMVNKIQRLQGELKKTYSYKNIVGQSDAMQQVFAQIDEVSAININVFVHGESGTGKELVAKALHFNSAYKMGDFVLSPKSSRRMSFSAMKKELLQVPMIPEWENWRWPMAAPFFWMKWGRCLQKCR